MTIETMVILVGATWYAAYAPTSTHGPFKVFEWLRHTIPHGGLLSCPVCLAFWVALILVTVTIGHIDIVLTWAVAGLAMLAHGITGWRYQND